MMKTVAIYKLALLPMTMAFAWAAWAGDVKPPVVAGGFTTGTGFSKLPNGVLDVNCNDEGVKSDPIYWGATENDEGVVVTNVADETNAKYVAIDTATPFDRLIMAREIKDDTVVASNVYLKTSVYTNLYADTWVKFTPCVAGPDIDASDRIIVWMSEVLGEDGLAYTNMVITAGKWDGKFGSGSTACEYTLTNVVVSEAWCHLTIYTIADATSAGKNASAFSVFIDGLPAAAISDGYDIGVGTRASWLTAESRLLKAERRLFPVLTHKRNDNAFTLSKMTFSGQGAVSNILFTSENEKLPSPVVKDNIFTLNWEAGVKSFDCIVSNATAVVTNKNIDATATVKVKDFSLGDNYYSVITITNLVIDTEGGYSNRAWTAANDCTVEGNVFTYDGKSQNPIGNILTTRNQVTVDGLSCSTFRRAKEDAKAAGKNLIALATNVTDKLEILSGEDFVLDLAGFTVQGNSSKGATIDIVDGGRLKIIDSSIAKTGRVLPPTNKTEAVNCSVQKTQAFKAPVLHIEGGWYDGEVVIPSDENSIGECYIGGGSFTNCTADTTDFYLASCITNTTIYYALQNEYWMTATNGFIWCGKGADTKLTTKENWKCGSVPGVDDLAIFPYAESPWAVDFGSGFDITNIWMDGDIAMSGTNDFTLVKIVGDGRFVGNGQIVFSGAIPGKLTANDSGSGTVRLGANWSGCVKLTDLSDKARTMNDITYWGTAKSTVEFNGVRGYVSDKLMHAQQYTLVLTDDISADGATTNVAWKNETGYTGSVVSFPELTGGGTFESPKNLRAVNQVIQFVVVSNYTGRLSVGGKRVLLGTGPITTTTSAGNIAFTSGVTVRSGLGWNATSCTFLSQGCTINVIGDAEDTLLTYTDSVKLNDAVANIGGKKYDVVDDNKSIKFADSVQGKMTIGTLSVSATKVPGMVRSGNTLTIPEGSAVTFDGNDVLVNGNYVGSIADYYALTPVEDSDSTYSVELDKDQVTPVLADFELHSDGEGQIVFKVTNAKSGLYYIIQTNASLSEDGWQNDESSRVQVTGDEDEILLESSVKGSSLFYRVIVTDSEK